jgi:hypothetical protein
MAEMPGARRSRIATIALLAIGTPFAPPWTVSSAWFVGLSFPDPPAATAPDGTPVGPCK